MNKVILMGRLTRDVEVRYSQSGTAFARVGIAVERPFSKDKAADFFNLTAFGKTAEFMGKYLSRGERVLINGRLQTSTYEGKDGIKRTNTDIIVDNVEFADTKKKAAAPSDDRYGGEPVDDEDTPF